MNHPELTELDRVQMEIHDATRNIASAIKLLKEWNAKGMSLSTMHTEQLLEIILKHVESSFEKLSVDAALASYKCSKARCDCKGFHQSDIGHTHCLCGHSQMDHDKRD